MTNQLVRLSIVCSALTLGLSLPVQAVVLITADEARQSARSTAMETLLDTAADPSVVRPAIEIRQPSLLSQPLGTPLAIELSFLAADAPIVPDSFRAYYGNLKLNITDRILKKVKVLADGLRVDDAELPSGQHKILLVIEDEKGRRGERELKFTVK
jgi:hypothetical protein